MFLFLLKLLLTPLLIALATLAARRWGPVVGGWIVSLPLTSAPVSVFLALEQGREFAADAAHGTLLGIIAVTAFSVVYARSAKRASWPWAILASLFCYALIVTLLARLDLPLAASALLIFAWIAFLKHIVGTGEARALPPSGPRWDLPFRMAAATAMVLAITAASEFLGPQWSGLLSGFPVFICVISVFYHGLYGPAAVEQFEQGVVEGSFAFAAFFLTVILTLPLLPLAAVYLAAALAAGGVNLLAWIVHCRCLKKS